MQKEHYIIKERKYVIQQTLFINFNTGEFVSTYLISVLKYFFELALTIVTIKYVLVYMHGQKIFIYYKYIN